MTEPAVIAKDLRKSYGDFVAVDGIDFEIQKGEFFGFLGPNGAGKTTTMRMIYRASPVGGGSLIINGHEAAGGKNDRAIKSDLGVVPQEDNLDQELSVRENLNWVTTKLRNCQNKSKQIDAKTAKKSLCCCSS